MARDLSKPIESIAFVVLKEDEGLRLDSWLSLRVPWRSRTDLQRRIHLGTVSVNGQVCRKASRVRCGDVICVQVDGPATEPTRMDEISIEILFEDPWLIALNKAAGTIVHPVGRHVNDTIVSALHVRYHAQSVKHGVPPMIVHRLDRDTSGVLVLAKDEVVRKALGAAFESRDVRKTYLAVVSGEIAEPAFTVNEPIGPDPSGESKVLMACTKEGRSARTHFSRLEHHQGYTLLRCFPETGRQHQIRVHLQFYGHPILCDRLYGSAGSLSAGDLCQSHPTPEITIMDRQALHAEALSFKHPITAEQLALYAPPPPDMMRLLDKIPAPPLLADESVSHAEDAPK